MHICSSPHSTFVLRIHLASFGTVPSFGELLQVTGSADDPKTIQRVVVSLDLVLLSRGSFDAAGEENLNLFKTQERISKPSATSFEMF